MATVGGYYNGHLSDYSDDFEDDKGSSAVLRAKPEVPAVSIRPSPAPGRKSFPQTRRSDVGAGKAARSTPRNTKSQPPRRRILASEKARALSETKHGSKAGWPKPYTKAYSQGVFSPRDRVISANRHALRTLQNKLSEAKRELEELRKENRLLNRLQVRQERELTKIQTQEGELPQILAQHTEEVRSLKDQLHRSQETARSHHRRASELHQELLKLTERKKKLEEVAKRKHLLEREALTVELQEKNDKLEEKNRRILELERTAEMMSRNHAQEVRQLRQRNKLLSLETDGLRNASDRMHTQLKEKERVMDVMNIYSQRIPRNMPMKTTAAKCQVESATSQTDISCPPFKSVSLQSRPAMKARGSQTELVSPARGQQSRSQLVAAGTQTDSDTDTDNERSKVVDLSSDVTAPVRQSHERGQAQEYRPPEQVKPARLVAGTNTVTKSGGKDAEDERLPQGKGGSPSEVARESQLKEDEEKRKKEMLLARLRALDSLKDPPGSQPITMPRSTAEQTANLTVGTGHPTAQSAITNSRLGEKPLDVGGRKLESRPPPVPQTHNTKTESDSEAQRKKTLLLAKLMAIDEGNDPSKVTVKPSKDEVSRPPQKHSARTALTGGAATSAHHSNTSLHSWPDTVDNMHRGKPAYSTEEDPLGTQLSRSSLTGPSSRKRSGAVRKEEGGVTFLTEGSPGEGSQRARVGRRPRGGEIGGLLNAVSGLSAGLVDEKVVPTAHNNNDASRRPLVGRRTQPNPPLNAPIFGDAGLQGESRAKGTASRQDSSSTEMDYPWEVRVQTNSSLAGPRSLGEAHRRASPGTRNVQSKHPLLPLRPKADQGFELMPGAIISEPDDIEEVVL